MIEKLGGTLKGAWLSFGDYDTIVVAEMPDHVSAAAFAMSISAGGRVMQVVDILPSQQEGDSYESG